MNISFIFYMKRGLLLFFVLLVPFVSAVSVEKAEIQGKEVVITIQGKVSSQIEFFKEGLSKGTYKLCEEDTCDFTTRKELRIRLSNTGINEIGDYVLRIQEIDSDGQASVQSHNIKINKENLDICTDGTLNNACSSNKPLFCENSKLVEKCGKGTFTYHTNNLELGITTIHTTARCGECLAGKTCQVDGSCVEVKKKEVSEGIQLAGAEEVPVPIIGETRLPETKEETICIKGDLDNNGKVNIFDLLNMLKALKGASNSKADVNSDGKTNIFDLLSLLKLIGKEERCEDELKCNVIFNNGDTSKKINIYFYENGFNMDMQSYDNYVKKVTAAIFGDSFDGETFLGIEPFNTLKHEFNVFSYKDEENLDDGSCLTYPFPKSCYYDYIKQELSEQCSGFSAPSDWGAIDGNYNIIVIPIKEGWGSGGSSPIRINQTTLKLISADTIFHNINQPIVSLVHEFGHRIGFFDEEYFYYNVYLGADTFYPNIDSFSCTKWCDGVDEQSPCYNKYIDWLWCFKTKFIDESPEIQQVLTENHLDYNFFEDYSWWGTCFNELNRNVCGNRIENVVDSHIRPQVYGLNKQPDEKWISNWNYCKSLSPYNDLAGPFGCDLGLNCGGNGCFVGGSFSRFLPSREDEFLMGSDYSLTSRFNKHDEDILRNNILNKVRYIEVENTESVITYK